MAERRKTESAGPDDGDGEVNYQTATGISLMERFRMMQEDKKKGKFNSSKTKHLIKIVLVLQIPSEVYVFINYLIPYFLEDSNPWALYYAKVLAFYIGLMVVVNYTCCVLYDPVYARTKDQPLLPVSNNNGEANEYFTPKIHDAISNNSNGNGISSIDSNGSGSHSVLMTTESDGHSWHFCEKCALQVPFRTHHCSICKKCVIKKDHHCFLLGGCVGFNNQRYFLVLVFYIILAGIVGGFFTITYIYQVAMVEMSIVDLILPINVFRWLFGSLSGFNCLLVTQLYAEVIFGLTCVGFFSLQTYVIPRGLTFYEYKKELPVRCTSSVSQNFRSVFGDFWALNFIFPMTLIFKQPGDGTVWDDVIVEGSKNGSKHS